MGTKLTPSLLTRAQELARAEHGSRAIAEILTRETGKSVSRASVSAWLKSAAAPPSSSKAASKAPGKAPKAAKRSAKAATAPPAPSLPSPSVAPPATDAAPMTPEAMFSVLSGMLAAQEREARRLQAEGDHVGARTAVRLVVQLGAILAKRAQADEDEDDVVKVKVDEMSAAADRAMRALHGIVDRVRAERATWPACPACGQPQGVFPSADRSPLRALAERFFGCGP